MFTTVVIGAGQAGLSAAYFLAKAGQVPGEDFVILDANPAAGGAWLHRWPSLTLGRAHNVHDLPGFPMGSPNTSRPAAEVVSEYYAAFEHEYALAVRRPVAVLGVEFNESGYLVHTSTGDVPARSVINATGTWDSPHWPHYPGMSEFSGTQIHTHDFNSVSDFIGKRVLVVGAGTSAVQFLVQLEEAGIDTVWSTRRDPDWVEMPFDSEWGRAVEQRVAERTLAGLPPTSVIQATGIPLTPEYKSGIERGVLVSRGKIAHLSTGTVVFDDGSSEGIDAIIWATGFRSSLKHLSALKIREPGGGILMEDSVRVAKAPGLFFVGYGPSASTLGATRAGRQAAQAALKFTGAASPVTS